MVFTPFYIPNDGIFPFSKKKKKKYERKQKIYSAGLDIWTDASAEYRDSPPKSRL